MIFILIITALATTANGSVKCNFTETSGGQQCFGAVGQQLLFLLSNTPNTEIKLIKDDKYLILKRDKHLRVVVNVEYVESHSKNHSELLMNGTFSLGKATKRHSGNYTVEEFRFNGMLLKKATVHLEIQAALSEPDVSNTCLSPKQMKVSCSSEGEGLAISLSLDGHLLINTSEHSVIPTNCSANTQSRAESTTEQDKSNVSSVSICLNGQQTGKLMCNVWNKVSRHETVLHLTDCKDFFSSFLDVTVTVAVIAAIVALLLLVGLYLVIKKRHHKPRPATISECNYESEVVYTEVTVRRNQKKKPEPNSHNNSTFFP